MIYHLKRYAHWYVLAMLAVSTAVLWYAVFAEARSGTLTVAFLDVGQGDATFIASPNGTQTLIDGSAGRQVLRKLSAQMPFYDRSIDMVIATHPDKDHIGGLPDVLARYDVSYFFEPGVAKQGSGSYQRLKQLLATEKTERVLARAGQAFSLGGGAVLEVLFPDRDVSGIDANAGSVIARIRYGDTEFLLPADAPQAIERYITRQYGAQLQSDVLKVGHHGSDTSSAPTFLAAASPEYAVISAGADNPYGHPHKEVLEAIENVGAAVMGTYEDGTIVFESDGSTVQLVSGQ